MLKGKVSITCYTPPCVHGEIHQQPIEWYLFNDDKTTKKRGEIALILTKENIVTQVTSLYYLKNEEVTMKGPGEVGAGGIPWI